MGIESNEFIVAVSFAVASVLIVVVSYAIHIVISKRRLEQAQQKLKALTANLTSVQERERKRIAEELHDRAGETLVLTGRAIQQLKKKLASPEASRDLDALSSTIQTFVKQTRSLIFDLIPPALYDIGLEAAVESLANHCRSQYGIEIRVEEEGRHRTLPQDLAVFFYNTVRELLLNAVRHGKSKAVTVVLSSQRRHYQVTVEDDGVGFGNAPLSTDQSNGLGFGLFNINVQAEHWGGYVTAEDCAGGGARVAVRVPLSGDEHEDHKRVDRG